MVIYRFLQVKEKLNLFLHGKKMAISTLYLLKKRQEDGFFWPLKNKSMSFKMITHFSNMVFSWFLYFTFAGFERRTKYGCEGTTLNIACEEGTVIHLVRANYGRFSISICNEEGITDWSVNCMEPRTLRVINAR